MSSERPRTSVSNDHSDTRQEKDTVSRANHTAMLFPGIMRHRCQLSFDELKQRYGPQAVLFATMRGSQPIVSNRIIQITIYQSRN